MTAFLSLTSPIMIFQGWIFIFPQQTKTSLMWQLITKKKQTQLTWHQYTNTLLLRKKPSDLRDFVGMVRRRRSLWYLSNTHFMCSSFTPKVFNNNNKTTSHVQCIWGYGQLNISVHNTFFFLYVFGVLICTWQAHLPMCMGTVARVKFHIISSQVWHWSAQTIWTPISAWVLVF